MSILKRLMAGRCHSQPQPPKGAMIVQGPSATTRLARVTLALALLAGSLCLLQQGIAQDALNGWSSEAATSAITLVAVEQAEGTTTFVLRNASTKPIMAFAVLHDDIGHTVDRFQTETADTAWEPGATHRLVVGSREITPSNKILLIAAVMFTDGTADGQQRVIDNISAHHIGLMLEQERIKNILLDIRINQGMDEAALQSVRARLGTRRNPRRKLSPPCRASGFRGS